MLFTLIGKVWKTMPSNTRRWLTRRFQTSFTVSAAGIVTNERNEVLLLNHVLRPTSGWGLPGGFMNKGEQPEAALRREMREETGIDLSAVRLVQIRTLHRHIEIIFAARGIGQPVVKSREITELGWFPLDEMPMDISRNERSMISSAIVPDE